jgi:RteC protein
MKEFTEELHERLINSLDELHQEYDRVLDLAEKACELIRVYLSELKDFVTEAGFVSEEEEITFFKQVKPRFYAQLIYYAKVYDIASRLPILIKEQKKHYRREFEKMHHYFEANQDFYRYYRQQATYMDASYFLRDRFDIKFFPDLSYLDSDTAFRTNKDYQMAKLLAYDMLNNWLETQLSGLEQADRNEHGELESIALPWTDTKAGLIELLYGIQCMGSLNNAHAGLTQIAKLLERAFNVDLGNYSRGFQEMSIRKKSRTPFLDRMREMLIKRMDEAN